jgi:heme-degrading monooxygenase HmoA
MHIQIINFKLKDLGEEEYAGMAKQLAPAYADVPGLVSKVWLSNRSTGTYGGVYFWSDRKAMEEFSKTDLFNTVATHPNLADISSTDFAVMEEPTKITRGLSQASEHTIGI